MRSNFKRSPSPCPSPAGRGELPPNMVRPVDTLRDVTGLRIETSVMTGIQIPQLVECGRCRGAHRGLIFRPVNEERIPEWFWAECPETHEPLLLRVINHHGATEIIPEKK